MLSITNHAQDKFKERYNVQTFREMVNIANYALKNGTEPKGKYLKLTQQGYQTFIYRELLDNIYVFESVHPKKARLLTVYQKKYDGVARKKPF